MKKLKLIKSICLFSLLLTAFTSCGANLDTNIFYETIGKDLETTPPGEVTELTAASYSAAAVLKWKNPADADLYGLQISASPATGTLEKPITYIKDSDNTLPQTMTISNLTNGTVYTITIKAFDRNRNFSNGVTVIAKPEAILPVIPADVKNLTASEFTEAVTLKWDVPSDNNIYGITISANPAAGTLEKPLTYIKDSNSQLPQTLAVTGLTGNVTYTFTIKTFSNELIYSAGQSVTSKPSAQESTTSSSFTGTGNIFSYKKNKIAFDFGYNNSEVTKTIELTATTDMNLSSTAFLGTGNFSLVSIEPKDNVKNGDKIKITVKYTPPSTPSWDEMDLAICGSAENRLTMIASNFKQPKDIKPNEENTTLGLKLWIRADLIGQSDLTDNDMVKRIPDFSGRGYHAYCTDSEYRYAPAYINTDIDFNNLPGIDFDSNANTQKSQFLVMGTGAEPIVNSGKGSTTFVVLKTPTDYSTQTIIAANYGQSFPTLINTNRYYNDAGWNTNPTYGWGIKGSGLYGTYRYPCVTTSTTDPNNTWFINSKSSTTSICMRFDQELSPNAITRADGRKDFPSNISMQINGKDRLLSFIYSNSTDSTKTPLGTVYSKSPKTTTSPNCYGSYGKPISDGKGHRYGTLSEVQTPSTTDIARMNEIDTSIAPSNSNKHIYYHWYSDFRSGTTADNRGASVLYPLVDDHLTNINLRGRNYPPERSYDWAYSTNPYEYYGENGTLVSPYPKSYASSDDNCPGAAYFSNWISKESRRNGTIYSLIIGTDNNIATLYRGKIAEVIMFDYALSDAEIAVMNDYIKYRYGIDPATTN